MKKFLRVMAPFVLLASVLCIPQVTERLPAPMKDAFTDLRKNAFIVASGEGFGKIEWGNPRGIWENKPSGGVQHVGGR